MPRSASWFKRLTGFDESDYESTRAQLEVEGTTLRSKVNGRSYGIGSLETPSLAELRARVAKTPKPANTARWSTIYGDARTLHADPTCEGAVFQVASQFNLLEMTGPEVTPEDGVARYESDPTQGPACAIACGAATIYRNYFVPVDGVPGQTRERQVDCLRDIGAALGNDGNRLWNMRNGYALCKPAGLDEIRQRLDAMGEEGRDRLRGLLRVGIQWDAQVTHVESGHAVSQVFCSALPVAYTPIAAPRWEAFARLVLEATYEATLCVAALNVARGGPAILLLTKVGGGVFGNDPRWIDDAIDRARGLAGDFSLDVRLVEFRASR